MKKILGFLLLLMTLLTGLPAQELGNFEDSFAESDDEYTEDDKETEEDWEEGDDEDYTFTDFLIEIFARIAWYAIVYGGAVSNERMHPEAVEWDGIYLRPRDPGEPLLPIFRSDTTFGIVDPELYCADQRIEFGYGAFGLSGRYSLFFETDRIANLHLWETYIHYRMSLGSSLEISPGLGVFGMEGTVDYDGFSMVLPVKMHVPGTVSLEAVTAFNFYPTEVVGTDFDISLLLDLGSFYPKAGYRRYGSDTSALNQVYLGCVIVY